MTAQSPLFSDADILVVDDNPVNVELLMDLLEDEGYTHVEGMTNPLLVIDRMLAKRPDLILLDIRMPGMSGLELLEKLHLEFADMVPAVIVLTAQIDEETRHQALSLGAQDFLTKPFNHIEVLQRINNTLHTLQLQRLISDRTERADLLEDLVKQRTKELVTLSRQDPVTSLPNRHVILEKLSQLKKENKDTLVFFIALEGLDEISRLHDYRITDQVLCELAKKVAENTSIPIRLLGVWSSNRWVVLCERAISESQAEEIAQKLLTLIEAPLHIEQLLLYVRARIGISATLEQRHAEQIIRMAAVALPTTNSLWQGYSQELEDTLTRRVQVRNALHLAVDRSEFHLLYQPKIDIATGQICGAEALLRWESLILGRVMPMEFIPVAEANGDIIAIGKWVITQTIADLLNWRSQQLVSTDFSVAVNVASKQLMQTDFASWLISTVEAAGLEPQALEVEVTESGVMTDMQLAKHQLQRLSTAGFKIAIDDFGTGYSSLAYLRTLPISILKIDREFIREMHNNTQDQRLTSTIIDMARHFQFKTVAEGVEVPAQLELLRKMGCDKVQGFMFAPPVNEATLMRLITTGFPAYEGIA